LMANPGLTTAEAWALARVRAMLPGLLDEPTQIRVACAAVRHILVPRDFTPEALIAVQLQGLDEARRRQRMPRLTAQEWAGQRQWYLNHWLTCEEEEEEVTCG